jgi:L-cysteine/cystine lyase
MSLRAEFPVFERVSYLNAGSVGPTPRAAAEAAIAEVRGQADGSRVGIAQFEHQLELGSGLRERAAAMLGADSAEVALTGATTDGVNAVIGGLELGPGDELLTSDEEHPGLLAPLAAARERRGISIRVVPFDELAGAASPSTRLIACSHVSWHTGRVADTEALAAAGPPVLLDGAQGLGAVPVDVRELGCDFYAASGQKWLCGPIGSGYLYVRSDRIEELFPIAPGYGSLEDPKRALELDLKEGAVRFDAGFPPSHQSAWALAAMDVLAKAGMEQVLARGPELAARLGGALEERGLTVAPRGHCTLVSWEAADPEAESKRLAAEGFVVRHLPGTPYVRASVGAWATEEELDRLAATSAS